AAGNADDAELDLITLILQWRGPGPPAAPPPLPTPHTKTPPAAGGGNQKERRNALPRPPARARRAIALPEGRPGRSRGSGEGAAEFVNSLTDLTRSIQAQTDLLRDRTRRPPNMTDDQANARIGQLADLSAFWHSVVGALAPRGLQPPTPRQGDVTVEPGSTAA